ncbi:EAL domain-containing protein [Curvibacter sp. APW13]|uniref:putative bifunctional diguanylate cyclase/phosphodiesterase n=1 Tax=Curvibacter sp. APW13 TaxID=3077236 RepID=UPI0028DE1CA7|nr:EAL domain-containing protein [Curvibacter sp. APW13]MDT8991047.1 EAL domain-containing protein [Curvibacter sp. APW13]
MNPSALLVSTNRAEKGAGYASRIAALEDAIDRLYESVPFGTHCVAADGTYSRINALELAWLGRQRHELIGKHKPTDFLTPASQELVRRHVENGGRSGFVDLELELMGADGEVRPIAMTSNWLVDPAGAPAEHRAILFDLTETRRAREQSRLAALAFDALTGICVTDAQGVVLQVNKAFTEITGFLPEDVRGKNMHILNSGKHEPDFYRDMWASISQKGFWQGEIYNRRKDGKVIAEWLSISTVKGADGAAQHYVGSFFDITRSKADQAEVSHLAFYDPLTQLPNRRLLQDRLAHALQLALRSGLKGALLYIDIDNFKTINDTRGHAAGDLVLLAVAQRLRASVRECDTVARIGGDEFVVLLDGLDRSDEVSAARASQVGQTILEVLSRPYLCGDFEFACSASIGVSMFGEGDVAGELLQHADMAMYQAKKAGRNALRFFNPAMQSVVMARVALDQDLRRAIEKQQFVLYFQPQVNAQGRVIGAEALLRWMHPERGMVPPGEFIPMAEETAAILPIGQWVLEAACAQLQRWQSRPATAVLQLAVNVSPRQFAEAEFVDRVLEVVERFGVAAHLLKLEITESMVLDLEDTSEKIRALSARGVRFSMDDFGTGYSSLLGLTRLPLAQLKIDQSFVQSMGERPSDAIVVQTVINMALSLELEVIAEGVETEEQRDFLARHGCHLFQGYLYSRPVPIAEFEAYLAGH